MHPGPRRPKTSVKMDKERSLKILPENQETLKCFHVRSLSVFGSVVRGESKPGSDIDILEVFEPDPGIDLFQFFRLKRELGALLGMEVDLGAPDALDSALKEGILKEAVQVA